MNKLKKSKLSMSIKVFILTFMLLVGVNVFFFAFASSLNTASARLSSTVTYDGILSYVFDDDTSTASVKVNPNRKTFAGAIVVPEAVTSDGKTYSVTSVYSGGFSGCSNMTGITLPSSITTIKSSAFSDCIGLTSITIPSSVTSIGDSAFTSCTNLASVTLSNGLKTIGLNAFYNCSITSITIPASVTTLYGSSFGYCTNLATISVDSENTKYTSSSNAAIYEGTKLVVGGKNTTINSTCTEIGAKAFYGRGITSITIPASVTTIESGAFNNSSLTSATFANTDGWSAGSTELSSTDLANTSTAATYLKSTYEDYSWIWEDGVKSDSYYWSLDFSYDSTTKTASVFAKEFEGENEYGVMETYHVFSGGELPSEVKHDGVVYTVTSIPSYGFAYYISNDPYISSITIPATITYIGENAFDGKHGDFGMEAIFENKAGWTLEYYKKDWEMQLYKVIRDISSSELESAEDAGSLLNDGEIKGTWYYTNNELQYSYDLDDNTAIVIGVNYLNGSELTIPTTISVNTESFSVTSIGSSAFKDQTGLVSVSFPSSVTRIRESAFSGCTNLSSITFAEGLKYIDVYAFMDCTSLTSVTLPASITTVDEGAFAECSALTSVAVSGTTDWYFYNDAGNETTISSVSFASSSNNASRLKYNDSNSIYRHYSINVPDTSYYSKLHFFNFDSSDKTCSVMSAYDSDNVLTASGYVNIPEKVGYNGTTYSVICIEKDSAFTGSAEGAFAGTSITSVGMPSTVAFIAGCAFQNCTSLTSINIPNGQIGSRAFYNCSSLSSVDFYSVEFVDSKYMYQGDSTYYGYLEAIESYTFYGCSSLTSIDIVGVPTYIGAYAFANSGLTSIDLSGCRMLESIGANAFQNCFQNITNYISINLSYCTSLTTIGELAFNGCSKVEMVYFPSSLTYIGGSAFYGCGLTHVYFSGEGIWYFNSSVGEGCNIELEVEDLIADPTLAVYYFTGYYAPGTGDTNYWSKTAPSYTNYTSYLTFTELTDGTLSVSAANTSISGKITIPSQVTWSDGVTRRISTIAESGFAGCTGITEISMPDTLTTISANAFNGCTGLTSISIPTSVSSIASTAFINTPNVTSVVGSYEHGYYYSNDSNNALYYKGSSKTLIYGLATAEIDSDTLAIGEYAFYGKTGLTSITIPSSVTDIGAYAFSGCTNLAEATFKSTDWYVNNNNIIGLADSSFAAECLRDIYEDEQWNAYLLESSSPFTFTYTVNTMNNGLSYTTATITGVKEDISGEIVIPRYVERSTDGKTCRVTAIGNSAFKGQTAITKIIIRDMGVGSYAFSGCTALKSVIFMDSDELSLSRLLYGDYTIGSYAFYGCTSLENVTLSKYLEEIELYTFYGCSSLTNITIPDNVTSIEPYAFAKSGLTRIDIPSKVTAIEYYAFYGCINLEYVTLEEGLEYIGAFAFYMCFRIEEVTLPATLIYIGRGAFRGSADDMTVTFIDQNNWYVTNDQLTILNFCETEYILMLNDIENATKLNMSTDDVKEYFGYDSYTFIKPRT